MLLISCQPLNESVPMPALTRRSFLYLCTGAAAVVLFRPAVAATMRVATNRAGVAIQGYDTHAYWAHAAARLGQESFTVEWKGVPWHFTTQEDGDQFLADPDSFAPQFGGFCTRAMSLKTVVDGDPEVWRIFEGKLYLFARLVGRDYFDKGEAAMIAAAQVYWDSLG